MAALLQRKAPGSAILDPHGIGRGRNLVPVTIEFSRHPRNNQGSFEGPLLMMRRLAVLASGALLFGTLVLLRPASNPETPPASSPTDGGIAEFRAEGGPAAAAQDEHPAKPAAPPAG